jgi:hypothetical protein
MRFFGAVLEALSEDLVGAMPMGACSRALGLSYDKLYDT